MGHGAPLGPPGGEALGARGALVLLVAMFRLYCGKIIDKRLIPLRNTHILKLVGQIIEKHWLQGCMRQNLTPVWLGPAQVVDRRFNMYVNMAMYIWLGFLRINSTHESPQGPQNFTFINQPNLLRRAVRDT